MEHSGHRVRLKNRISEHGFDRLYEHELLEYMLFGALPRGNTNVIAHQLLDEFGSLQSVLNADSNELKNVSGMGESAVLLLKSYQHVANILNNSSLKPSGVTMLKNMSEVIEYFKLHFNGKMKEEFHALLIDSRGVLKKHIKIYSSRTNHVNVDVGMLAKAVADYSPRNVVIAHNHPSGKLIPSFEDKKLTYSINVILKEAFNIELSDHLIFSSSGEYVSLRQEGWLEDIFKQKLE